jgi:hypothetical protein
MHANTHMKITQGKYNDKKKKKITREKNLRADIQHGKEQLIIRQKMVFSSNQLQSSDCQTRHIHGGNCQFTIMTSKTYKVQN